MQNIRRNNRFREHVLRVLSMFHTVIPTATLPENGVITPLGGYRLVFHLLHTYVGS